jgi:sulfur-oxidizing protein SoxY
MSLNTLLAIALAAATLAGPATAQGTRDTGMIASPAWEEIKGDVVGNGPIQSAEDVFEIDAPFRAQDAAIVPIHITQPPGAPALRSLTLVVDENPAPVVAEFTFGPAMGRIDLETRIRVDAYSNVRAIAEGEDGTLYMTAPASKDAAEALAALGQMRARWFDEGTDGRREAQVMLRHPNYSGLQRNQITNLYVPARFVDTLEVRQGAELLFSMEGGISISEDPSFRFRYDDAGKASLSVHATDTDGIVFEQTFAPGT